MIAHKPSLQLVLLLGFLYFCLDPSFADSLSAAEVGARLSTPVVNGEEIAIEEIYQNAFFKHPQRSFGTISYNRQSGVFEKRLHAPDEATMRMSASVLSITEGGRTRSISADQSRAISDLFLATRAIVSGEFEYLDEAFDVTVSQTSASDWSMRLEPNDKSLRAEIETIDVEVAAGRVAAITTRFTNGDWREMRLLDTK